MAEELLRYELVQRGRTDIHVVSAGTNTLVGLPPTPETIEVMKSKEIDVSRHLAQPLSEELVHNADVVFCMENHHREAVLEMAPDDQEKVHLLRSFHNEGVMGDPNIPDPIGRSSVVYELCMVSIQEGIDRILKWIDGQ